MGVESKQLGYMPNRAFIRCFNHGNWDVGNKFFLICPIWEISPVLRMYEEGSEQMSKTDVWAPLSIPGESRRQAGPRENQCGKMVQTGCNQRINGVKWLHCINE